MKFRSRTVYPAVNEIGRIPKRKIKNKMKRIIDAVNNECLKDPNFKMYVQSKGRQCVNMSTKYNLIVLSFSASS